MSRTLRPHETPAPGTKPVAPAAPESREMLRAYALPEPGEVIAGKYELVRQVGEGGMGVVFEAMHTALRQRVAIKFVRPDLPNLGEVIARFEREASTVARMKSIHVARVIDVDRLSNGLPYMVVEYLEGHDLEAEIQRAGALGIEDAVDIVLQVAEAMGEAHALGIVHRDLKPSNLFLAKVGKRTVVKVLDFGISKGPDGDKRLTQASAYFGTPQYAAPEQMRSAALADARSDVWSLGAILYEFVTGRPPFDAPSPAEVISKVMTETPVPASQWRPDVPVEVEEAIARALCKDPAGRFQSMEEMVSALDGFGPPQSVATAMLAAPLPRQRLGDLLVADGLVTAEGMAVALERQGKSGQQLGRVLIDLGMISKADLLTALAKQNGLIITRERVSSPDAASDAGSAASTSLTGAGDVVAPVRRGRGAVVAVGVGAALVLAAIVVVARMLSSDKPSAESAPAAARAAISAAATTVRALPAPAPPAAASAPVAIAPLAEPPASKAASQPSATSRAPRATSPAPAPNATKSSPASTDHPAASPPGRFDPTTL